MPRISSSKREAPQIEARDLRTFHTRLARWYKTHGRHSLPWRQTDDAYKIWISEVMLQQTQVATVLDRYYGPFLKAFPTIRHLAEAPREQVLKAWEGLGYYRRAGFLHEAAKQAAKGLPRNFEELHALPGIGKNTAHAILSFAHHQPVAILEANVKRIVARIFAVERPKDELLWAGADTLLDRKKPFDHNQAMMDLGSMICTPRAPKCSVCPAHIICEGKHAPERYPARKAKKAVPIRERILLVLEDASGRLHLEAREDALLGGLYGFPQLPTTTDLRYAMREMHIDPADWHELGAVNQTYSHFKLAGNVRYGRLRRRMNSPGWYSRAEIAALPLSRADHKVLALVENRHSAAKKR